MDKKGMHSEKSEMKMDKGQDKAMIKKAFKQHDMQEHKGGKGTSLKLKKGGMSAGCGYDKGGKVKKFAMGGYMGGATFPNQQFPMQQQAPQNTMLNAPQPPGTPSMPYNNQTAFKKGGAVKRAYFESLTPEQIDRANQRDSIEDIEYRGPAPVPGMPYPGIPYRGMDYKGPVPETKTMKKGGSVKKMAMGGAPMMPPQAPVDPRIAMMAKKKAPRGVAPKPTGMMPPRPPMAAPQVAPTAPMKKGGMAKCATGGMTKGESPIQRQAKGGAKVIKMAKGGSTSSRGDGCAIRGKTRA
jgi:hypothetical protein